MPGPATLVAQVVRDLEAGYCAVVGLPKYSPPAFRLALRRAAERPYAPREWHRLSTPPLPGQPLPAWLWEQWHDCEARPCPPNLTVGELLAQPFERMGSVWELPELTNTPAAEWLKFLDDYQQALPQVAQINRNVLLVVVEEPAALNQLPRRNQPQLTFHQYRLQPTRLDMLLFLSQQLPPATEMRLTPLARELRIYTAAALFATDPTAALQQAETNLLDPGSLGQQLTQQQIERCWNETPAPIDQEAAWAGGWLAYVNGQPEQPLCAPHPAPLLTRIQQALWLGQMRVLLPWLEQRRWQLLHQPELKGYLQRTLQKRPFIKQFEQNGEMQETAIQEPEKLEIGQLLTVISWHRLEAGRAGLLNNPDLRRQLELLRDCRNDLSHLSPLGEARLINLLGISFF